MQLNLFVYTYKRSGAIHIMQPGLITGRKAGRQNKGILKFAIDQNILHFTAFNKVTMLLQQYECIQASIFG